MPRRPARSSWLGRALLGAAAIAFAYLGYVYLSLPDVRPLARENPTGTAFIALRIAEAKDEGRAKFTIRQKWVPYNQIAATLKRAVVVTEDAAFFDHDGIDLDELPATPDRVMQAMLEQRRRGRLAAARRAAQ